MATITLAQVTAYLACAPKSNASVKAIAAATKDVEEQPLRDVPLHLKDAHYQGAKELGHGEGYVYPHDAPGGHVDQEYMPAPVRYYVPTDRGYEAKLKAYLEQLSRKPPAA